MDTSKIYHDTEGNERTIHQMVKEEPQWAAARVQEGEKAIELLDFLEAENKKARYTGKCLFRLSVTGRGWRLHETSGDGACGSVREAISAAIKASK